MVIWTYEALQHLGQYLVPERWYFWVGPLATFEAWKCCLVSNMAHISPNHAKKIVSGVLMDSEEDIPHGVHQVTEKSLWGQMFWYFCASGVLVGNHKRLFCCKSINCITSYHKKRKLPQITTNYHKLPQTTTNYHKLPQTSTKYHKLIQTTKLFNPGMV
mgnify:CR=1 FL=1